MYGGHFPPLGHPEMVEAPPIRFFDREGREIELRAVEQPSEEIYEALLEMYLDFDSEFRTLGIPPIGEERLREWQEALLAGHCVLAWHADHVVGQGVLVPDPSTDPPSHELAVFVHQDYHGARIGTRLVEALLSHGRERGVERVWLLVERNNPAAVALYRRVGFVVTGSHGADVEMGLSMER